MIDPPNDSASTAPDQVATETNHVSNEHRMTLTLPNHVAQPASEAEDDSTPTS